MGSNTPRNIIVLRNTPTSLIRKTIAHVEHTILKTQWFILRRDKHKRQCHQPSEENEFHVV